MYTSVDISSEIDARRRVPCSTNKGVSYTNLVAGLAVTLKISGAFTIRSRASQQLVFILLRVCHKPSRLCYHS